MFIPIWVFILITFLNLALFVYLIFNLYKRRFNYYWMLVELHTIFTNLGWKVKIPEDNNIEGMVAGGEHFINLINSKFPDNFLETIE